MEAQIIEWVADVGERVCGGCDKEKGSSKGDTDGHLVRTGQVDGCEVSDKGEDAAGGRKLRPHGRGGRGRGRG